MDVQEAVLKVLENEQNANYIVDLIEWTEVDITHTHTYYNL